MSMSMVEEIKALKELLDMGAITQDDYDAKKAQILGLNAPSQPVEPSERPTFVSADDAIRGYSAAQPAQPVAQPAGYAYQAGVQPAQAPVSSEKSKIVAGVLAILLGTLGIHKFYLGYTREGVIMILVAIFGAFLLGLGTLAIAVIALVEGILYLTKSDAEFERIYIQGRKGWF